MTAYPRGERCQAYCEIHMKSCGCNCDPQHGPLSTCFKGDNLHYHSMGLNPECIFIYPSHWIEIQGI